MLKQTITWQSDFDDATMTEDAYFNIRQDEIDQLLHIQKETEDLQELFTGGPRELTRDESMRLLNLVKELIRVSYGKRVGNRHHKSPEIWQEFVETGAHNAFLMSLFEDTNKAVNFMTEIWPRNLREENAEKIAEITASVDRSETPVAPPTPIRKVEDTELPQPEEDVSEAKEIGEETHEELIKRLQNKPSGTLTKDELLILMKARNGE